MSLTRISLCYYPTTVLLLDDNSAFLSALELSLSNHLPVLINNSTKSALKFIFEEYQSTTLLDQYIMNNNEENGEHLFLSVDIRNIHKEIYNNKRFSEITVIVVDYAMPEINGLEFSRLVRQKLPQIKIIMLTGEADQSLAVDAFNEGIIDKFILKNSDNIVNVLIKSINELQIKYFNIQSEVFFTKINQNKGILECLSDPTFIELFRKICKVNNIVEYFMLDNQGSFLLVNKEGEPSWFLVKTEQEMDSLYRYAQFEEAPISITNALENKQKIPFFFSDSDMQTIPSGWGKFLHNANLLIGKETYYYAYVDKTAIYNILTEKVMSYKRYLSNLNNNN